MSRGNAKNLRKFVQKPRGPTYIPLEAQVAKEDLTIPIEEMNEIIKDLSQQQASFVQEFVISFNSSDAARKSGYSKKCAGQAGNSLLKNPKVREAIGKLLTRRSERLGISAEWVLTQLKKITEMCMAELVYEESIGDESVKKKKFDPTPAIRALELIGRNQKMWTDKIDHSSSDGTMSPAGITEGMDAKQAAEAYAALIKGGRK